MSQDVLLGVVIDGQSLNRYAYVGGNPVGFVEPIIDESTIDKVRIERSENPPAKRDVSTSKKDVYEKAKRAGRGKEPIHHHYYPKP